MITVSRAVLKRFRTLCRRGGLHKYRASNGPVVTLIGGPAGYRMNAASPDVAIEYRHPDPCDAETIRLPLDALEACEGRDDAPVVIEARSGGGASLSWVDRGVPRQSEVEQPQPGTVVFPDTPTTFTPNEPGLWPALRDAVATTDESSTRYALGCLHLRGKIGRIEAADGHQILVQAGYQFGWEDDVLIPGSKLLGCPDLDLGEGIAIGRAGEWVAVGVSRWLIYLRVQGGRFPKIDQILPNAASAKSRLELSGSDARFLAGTLPRLPCDDAQHDPITLDLNGQVLIRSRQSEQARPTEVVLTSSRLTGEPVVLNTNRFYVERALKLGFENVCLYGPDSPAMCADERRQFLWALLHKDSAIKRSDDPIRIESSTVSVSIPRTRKHSEPAMSVQNLPPVVANEPAKPVHRIKRPCSVPKSGPIEQAIALRDALRNTTSVAHQLVRALKQRQRQSRIVESTLASLKQLQKVAG